MVVPDMRLIGFIMNALKKVLFTTGMFGSVILLIAYLIVPFGFAEDTWGKSKMEIKRLKPNQFTELPQKVIKELESIGCTIPQVYYLERRWNVIHGEFAKKGQKDWAVLCSRNGVSSVLVFWGGQVGEGDCPNEIASAEDKAFLQVIGNGQIGFSRAISAVSKRFIESAHKAFGGLEPPPIDHEGIDDEFMDKASVVYYCYKGKWLQLQGSD